MSENIHQRDFVARYYEGDCAGVVRATALLDYLQETAAAHASQMGVCVADLASLGLTWVISRMHLVIDAYPRVGDLVRVRTWPSAREGIFSCREFLVSDAAGGELARATSSWAVLDMATRRPVRLEERLPGYPLVPRRAVDDPFATLPVPEEAPYRLDFRVRRHDLDVNRHVNNVIYALWALETVPAETADRLRPWEIEISFRAEAHYGAAVMSTAAEAGEGTFLHRILSETEGRELARLRTRWKDFIRVAGAGEKGTGLP